MQKGLDDKLSSGLDEKLNSRPRPRPRPRPSNRANDEVHDGIHHVARGGIRHKIVDEADHHHGVDDSQVSV